MRLFASLKGILAQDSKRFSLDLFKTDHFQTSLPRLRVPSLNSTLKDFLTAVEPLLSSKEYQKQVHLVKEFEEKDSPILQTEIQKIDKANPHTNYLFADTLDECLKNPPHTLSIDSSGSSPHAVHWVSPIPASLNGDILLHAARWVRGIGCWTKALQNNEVPPPALRGLRSDGRFRHQWSMDDWLTSSVIHCPACARAPLLEFLARGDIAAVDTSGFSRVLGGARTPGARGRGDSFRSSGSTDHFVVCYKNRMFVSNLFDFFGVPMCADAMKNSLEELVRRCKSTTEEPEVASFTSLCREQWRRLRAELLCEPSSCRCIEQIESALFVLNLHLDVSHMEVQCAASSPCRWVDKSFIIDVFPDRIELGGEGGVASTTTLQRVADDVEAIYMRTDTASLRNSSGSAFENFSMQELQWQLSYDQMKAAQQAAQQWRRRCALEDWHFTRISPDISKGQEFVTDGQYERDEALLQLATLVAWWRWTHRPFVAVEPVSLEAFQGGPMTALHLQSPNVMAFCNAMDTAGQPNLKSASRDPSIFAASLFEQASKEYITRKRRTLKHSSFHSHLLALRCTSDRCLSAPPPFLAKSTESSFASPYQLLFRPPHVTSSIVYSNCCLGRLVSIPYSATGDSAAGIFHVLWNIVRGTTTTLRTWTLDVTSLRGNQFGSSASFGCAIVQALSDISYHVRR